MNSYHQLINVTPSDDWRDGSPIGSGTVGAIVYGRVADEIIALNHESLWYEGATVAPHSVGSYLSKVRELVDSGQYREANNLYPDLLKDRIGRVATYHPACDIRICCPQVDTVKSYNRILDLETGRVDVKWSSGGHAYERSAFVSRVDDAIVIRMRSLGDSTFDMNFSLCAHDLRDAINRDGTPFTVPIIFESYAQNDCAYIYGQYIRRNGRPTDKSHGYGVMAKVCCRGASVTTDGHQLMIRDAKEFVIVVKLEVGGTVEVNQQHLASQMTDEECAFDSRHECHARLHRELFLRTDICLNSESLSTPTEHLCLDSTLNNRASTELIEKMADYGRYLLICSSKSGGLPSNLQGIWNGDYQPPWSCFYMLNENLQMNYWQALPGALPECVEPVFDFYERYWDDFRLNARQLYDCGGVLIPALMSPDTGLYTNADAHIVYWVSAAGWLAQLYIDYWQYTHDDEFLRNRAMPYLLEVVKFYEDFLQTKSDGTLSICPSVSPENTPGNLYNRACHDTDQDYLPDPQTLTRDSTIDVAIAREVFRNTIEVSKYLGINSDMLERWQDIIGRLPDYKVNPDGAIREWIDDKFIDNDYHRHLAHLYPFFPGIEIQTGEDPELATACLKALKNRRKVGLAHQTGWSLCHMANAYARLEECDAALDCLDILCRTCVGPNLFTYHNDYRGTGTTLSMLWGRRPPFQIDANMGFTAAIYEMLLFSVPGRIRLCPCLPSNWRRGHVTGLQARGGITVNINWDQDEGHLRCSLRSRIKQRVMVECRHVNEHARGIELLPDQDYVINLNMKNTSSRSGIELDETIFQESS